MFTIGGVGPAQADNGPHVSTAVGAGLTATMGQAGGGRCASCHRAHTAKAEMLLKEAQPALCFSCHANGVGASTDVVNGVGPLGKGLRGGGFTYALINGAAAWKKMGTTLGTHGYPVDSQAVPPLAVGGVNFPGSVVTSKHQIDGTTPGTMWGNGAISSSVDVGKASVTLECASCHDPHGNGNYRILRTNPVDSQWVVTPAVIANPTAVPPVVGVPAVMSPVNNIKIPDATAYGYTTANYWLAGDTNVPAGGSTTLTSTAGTGADGYIQNVAAWCTTCHTRYLAPTGSYKTASGDATFMYRHRSDANYKAGAANCITCHVSHGSNAVMAAGSAAAAVTLPGGATAPAGDSRLLRVDNRGTCVMCHNV